MPLNEPEALGRVTFMEFLAPDDPMLLAWTRFRSSLAGLPRPVPEVRPAQPVSAESSLWRLLAANNRELGRSFMLYRHFEVARAHVEKLQARPDLLTVEHVRGPNTGSCGWVIMAGDTPVMTCSRWYSSLSAGAVAADRALSAFRTAFLTETADRSDASGRFRRRTPLVADARP